MNEAQVREGLLNVAVPGLFGALSVLITFWIASIVRKKDEHSKLAKKLERLGPVLGLGAAYITVLAIYPTLNLTGGSASDRQGVIVIAAILFAIIESLTSRATVQPTVRWLGRLALVGGVLGYQYMSIRRQWDPGTETIVWHAGIGLWMLLAFGALDRLSAKTTITPAALTLAIVPMLALPSIFDAGAASNWQVAMGVGFSLVGIALAGLVFRGRSIGQAIGTVYIVWLSSVLVACHFVSYMPLWHACVLASTPLLMVVPEFVPKLKSRSQTVVRYALLAAACIVISWASVPSFFDALTGKSSGDEFDYYGMVD
ncbi:MAG: hypothetical protein Phyf2KO_01950 [Phycisphaerales bacterium]